MAFTIGRKDSVPVYETQNKTLSVTASNISSVFTITNSSYYFVGSGSTFTTNNGGVHGSTAKTTLTALYDMTVSFSYSYSSEASYDKFTLIVGGTTVANAVSGATTSKTYSGTLKKGQSIVFQYVKDGSTNSNDDKCTFSNIQVSYTVQTQTGSVEKDFAHKGVAAFIGDVNGKARKVLKAWIGDASGKARLIFKGGLGGVLLAVGGNQTVLKSEDGVEWEQVASTINSGSTTKYAFNNIAYGNGVLVTTYNYRIYRSLDKGQTWTMASAGNVATAEDMDVSSTAVGNGLAFGNGRFVMMSGSRGYPYTWYSVDGNTWTGLSAPKLESRVFRVQYVGNKFFAFTIDDSGRDEDVWVSDDGITWTDITDAFTYGYATTWVVYTFGKYYINTGTYVYYSTNGTSWTRLSITTSSYTNGIYCAAASEDVIAMAGAINISGSGGIIYQMYMTSDHVVSSGTGLSNTVYDASAFTSMIYQDKFVVVGANSQIAYSNDGKKWTQITALDTSVLLRDICFMPDE